MNKPEEVLETYRKSWDAFLEAYMKVLEENKKLKEQLNVKAIHG